MDLLGDEEIALVRKKLKWNSKPFEIPKDIFDEWRKIGKKNGEQFEIEWQTSIKKNNYKMKGDLEKNYLNSELDKLDILIEKEKTKYFNLKNQASYTTVFDGQLKLFHLCFHKL